LLDQGIAMSEIGDLVDHIDEILGEIEEELLMRDRLIQHLRQNELSQPTNPIQNRHDNLVEAIRQFGHEEELIQRANPDEIIRQVNPDMMSSKETSSWRDLLTQATGDLTEIKFATERARKCLFLQVTINLYNIFDLYK
jgi:hypothetical protein